MSDDFEIHPFLGPAPALSIATLADLGLSNVLIARYFAIDLGQLHALQRTDCFPRRLPSDGFTAKD